MHFKQALHLLKKTFRSFSTKEEIISVILVIIIVISTYSFFSSKNTAADPTETEEEVFVEGIAGKIKTLNPLFVEFNNAERDICSLIFSGLSKYDPVQKKVVEDIATHTLDFDKRIYTFMVKDSAYWHDGTKVTANDVYFTYHDIIQNPNFKNPILKSNFHGIEIKKIDEKTVEFHLTEPNSFFFTNTVIGLLPEHIWKDVPVSELDKNELNLTPVGSGPYKVKEPYNLVEDHGEVALEAFENYYGEKPKIQNVVFYVFKTWEDLIENRNAVHGISKIHVEKDLEKIVSEKYFNIYDYYLPQYTAMFINTDAPFLKDKKVRLGLLKSINKEELTRLLGSKRRIDTPLLELNQEEWLNKYSIEEAQGAFYDSGWRFDSDEEHEKRIRKNKDGKLFKLKLIALKPDPETSQALELQTTLDYIKESLLKVGCDLQIKLIETSQELQEKIKNRDYDLLLYGQHLGYNLDTYAYWHSSQAAQSGLNLSNYRNLKADSLIEAIRQIFDNEKKQETLNRLGEIIEGDVPAIFLYTPVYHYAVNKRVENIQIGFPSFSSDRLSYLYKWSFQK